MVSPADASPVGAAWAAPHHPTEAATTNPVTAVLKANLFMILDRAGGYACMLVTIRACRCPSCRSGGGIGEVVILFEIGEEPWWGWPPPQLPLGQHAGRRDIQCEKRPEPAEMAGRFVERDRGHW